MKHIEAMQKAIDALLSCRDYHGLELSDARRDQAITALREALAEQAAPKNVGLTIYTRDETEHGKNYYLADDVDAMLGRLEQQAVPVVPEGWKLGSPITEAMHVAACKVLRQANGLDGTPQRMLDAMLAAAPAPQAEQPALQQCWCTTCRPITLTDMRFVVCHKCGNKRCPKANDHRNACTGSNDVGQKGSSWEHVKPVGEQPAQREMLGPVAIVDGDAHHIYLRLLPDGLDLKPDTKLYAQKQPAPVEDWGPGPHEIHSLPENPNKLELALAEAMPIATSIWERFYQKTAPDWEVASDLRSVLSQIDNMVAGLKTEQPAQQEPVAELLKQSRANFERNFGKGGQGWADWIYGDIAELLSEHPPAQPQRQPLTEMDIMAIAHFCRNNDQIGYVLEIARAIEAAHGITESKT